MGEERDSKSDDTFQEAVRRRIRSIERRELVREGLANARVKSPQRLLDAIDSIGEKSPDEILDSLDDHFPDR